MYGLQCCTLISDWACRKSIHVPALFDLETRVGAEIDLDRLRDRNEAFPRHTWAKRSSNLHDGFQPEPCWNQWYGKPDTPDTFRLLKMCLSKNRHRLRQWLVFRQEFFVQSSVWQEDFPVPGFDRQVLPRFHRNEGGTVVRRRSEPSVRFRGQWRDESGNFRRLFRQSCLSGVCDHCWMKNAMICVVVCIYFSLKIRVFIHIFVAELIMEINAFYPSEFFTNFCILMTWCDVSVYWLVWYDDLFYSLKRT